MAIFHLSVKPMSRAVGRSATAAAAYRSGELVHDLTTDEVFDYTRKKGVEHSEIVLPASAAEQDIHWARDRQALWNAAERAENRSNSRVAREYEVALPHELSQAQRLELVRGFASEIANRHGVAVDFAIHAPHREGDKRNHHAHLMATTRTIEPDGLGAKVEIEWSDGNRRKAGLQPAKAEITAIRGLWETHTNEKLREHGLEIRVDHRSLEAQGVDREPTSHLGVAVSGMERRGIETEVSKRIGLEAATRRLEQAAELGQIEREAKQVQRDMLDLSGDLAAARKERERSMAAEPPATNKHAQKTRRMFEGLQLGTGTVQTEPARRFAGLQLPTDRSPARPLESDSLRRAVDRYARAWLDQERMRAKELPILEHQKIEAREAGLQLDAARPGAKRDLMNSLAFEPATYQSMTHRQGEKRTAALVRGIEHEERVRQDPDLKAERVVKIWNGLEAQREQLQGWEHKGARLHVEEQMKSMVDALKRDPALENRLRARQVELGIEHASRLDRVMREPDRERAIALSVRDFTRSLGLSR